LKAAAMMTMTSSNSATACALPDPVVKTSVRAAPAPRIEIETRADHFAFDGASGETILVSGLAAGHELPYECATGTCGSCHARVMRGAVDPGWLEAPAYAKLHPEKGDVLMCQARAAGDCMLRVRTSARQPEAAIARSMIRTAVIGGVRRLTHDVLHFEASLSQPMDFEAGQFVTIRSPSVVGRRAYSMANFGHGVDALQFVVKRKPGGGFSDWLFDGAIEGANVEIAGPLGRATFRPETDRNIVCVAGGSGVAGMMAILRRGLEIGHFERRRASLFFGVRTLADGFYLNELAEIVAATRGRIDVTLALSHEQPAGRHHPQFPEIALATGMAHEATAVGMAGRWDETTGFIAGPQPMVDATLRVFITEGGLRTDQIRFDKFT
jgi:toluene monooxygenase electron transfer component